jgi:hypothetical protein
LTCRSKPTPESRPRSVGRLRQRCSFCSPLPSGLIAPCMSLQQRHDDVIGQRLEVIPSRHGAAWPPAAMPDKSGAVSGSADVRARRPAACRRNGSRASGSGNCRGRCAPRHIGSCILKRDPHGGHLFVFRELPPSYSLQANLPASRAERPTVDLLQSVPAVDADRTPPVIAAAASAPRRSAAGTRPRMP